MEENESIFSADTLSRLEYASRGEVPVRLTLTSTHVLPDLGKFAPATMFSDGEDELGGIMESVIEGLNSIAEGESDEPPSKDGDNTSVFCTQAGMRTECGVITITYQESPDCLAEIIFDTGKPEMVTIHRTGGIMNTLVLEKGKRHISVYSTPIMPFEAAAYAKKVDSSLTFEDGGEISLDYLIELRGTDLQRTKMVIKAEIM